MGGRGEIRNTRDPSLLPTRDAASSEAGAQVKLQTARWQLIP